MFRSLYAKLAIVLALLFTLVGAVTVGLIAHSTAMYEQEVIQRANRDLAAQIVDAQLLLQNGGIREEALKDVFHMMMVVNPAIQLYLLRPDGKLLAYSAAPGQVKLDRVDMAPVHRFVDGGSLPVIGEDPRHPDVARAFSAAPIRAGGELQGYLYVILADSGAGGIAERLRSSAILRFSVLSVGGAIIVALLGGLIVFASLTRRLRRLDAAVQRFRDSGSAGDVPAPRRSTGGDEIDGLHRAFHGMARQLEEQLDRLRQTDRLRRELVANVSHDLRTPLTTLNGYLETVTMKAGELSAEERRRYLEAASRNGRHLAKLVAELFELAKLDADEERPQTERFSMAELMHDVAQKYQPHTEAKGVTLATDVPGRVPPVVADIGLMERVLDNLIENAMRYTPEGGRITLHLHGDRPVTAEVRDTGCGIAHDDLPRIFDRFYKPARSGGRDGGGAGLGLAIARRIVQLHGSDIRVTSAPGKGTTFAFEVPVEARPSALIES
ncbi:MAG: HAMP domain-containing sensor histidine kinase [Ectothiorhodospiraceae bacterium]|jgi:signal transduction histidine kinase